jgi:hypothetical protein
LAQRSAEAAREIKTLIGNSIDRVEAGGRQVAEAGQAMQAIVSQVGKVTDLVGEIATASGEQSRTLRSVSESMGQVTEGAQAGSQQSNEVASAAEVQELQHGFVPNVRNLAMYWFIGLADKNCMPGTYLFAWDLLTGLRVSDPTGYQKLVFTTYPGLPHTFPPGEPAKALGVSLNRLNELVFWKFWRILAVPIRRKSLRGASPSGTNPTLSAKSRSFRINKLAWRSGLSRAMRSRRAL